MTSKHTAGNWRWIDTLSCSSVYAGNPERRLASYVSPNEEDRANARLIAAAPELLEALVEAIECGMVPISSASDGGASTHSRQVRCADMIRAALAKATGES